MQNKIDYMLEFIQEFIDDKKARSEFKSQFSFLFSRNLAKMRTEDCEFTEAMSHYILDTGLNVGGHLSDGGFKALIRLRYSELLATRRDEL